MSANRHNIAERRRADKIIDDFAEEMLRETEEPWTYIVRAGATGAVKIGRAHNVWTRLRELQVSNHEDLRIIRVIEGDDERAFHQHFAHLRIRGEWFRYDDEMLLFVSPTGLKMEEYKRLCGWGADMVAGDIMPVRGAA